MDIDIPLVIETIKILGTVGASLTAVLGVFWWILRRYTKSLRHDIELLEGNNDLLQKKYDDSRSENENVAFAKTQLVQQLHDEKQTAKETRQELQKCRDEERALRAQIDAMKTAQAKQQAITEAWKKDAMERVGSHIEKLKQQRLADVAELSGRINKADEELQVKRVSHDHLQIIRERIKNISSLDGKLWNRPVSNSAPVFRPRKTPIISILNLKGGVGKTTITANLGATLAQRGKKVLMIDLDFQRSLSRLLLSTDERKIRHLDRHCLQHFLSGKTHDPNALIKMVGEPIADLANCWFLPNSDSVRDDSSDSSGSEDDSLEETEMRLMIDWIFESDDRDIRFHLREALHDGQIEDCFDYVLLDCPPRLTTACINALVPAPR